MLVRTLVPLACAGLALVAAAPAEAARDIPPGLTLTLASDHFVAHYGGGAEAAADAREAVAAGEQAYAMYVGTWGYPPPLDDGDGKTDVYVAPGITNGAFTAPDSGARRTSASITMDAETARGNPYLLAHEYFHAIQMGIYAYAAIWVLEGSAGWAGGAAIGGTAGGQNVSGSLDCRPTECDNAQARSRSVFFWYLSARFGPLFLADVLQRAGDRAVASGDHRPHDIDSLEEALAANGTSLTALYRDFAVATLWGYLSDISLTTGTISGALPDQTVTVAHLAAQYIALDTPYGPGDLVYACAPGTLTVTVDAPSGQAGLAALSVDAATPVQLTPSGDSASTTVTWSTCGKRAIVALPNPSVTEDGLTYTLHASVALGPVPIPTVKSKIPSKLRATRSGVVTLPVVASTLGKLEVTFKSRTVRKTFKLAKGNNSLKLKLPRSVRAGKHKITLVPISQEGRRGKKTVKTVRLIRPRKR